MESLGIKFPFAETRNGGVIEVVTTDIEMINSNLKAFLTLKRGQRVMNNALYSPLYDYIMEGWDEITETSLTEELRQKLVDFFPEIEVNNIIFVFDEEKNFLHLTLEYTIIDLKIGDNVSISVALES